MVADGAARAGDPLSGLLGGQDLGRCLDLACGRGAFIGRMAAQAGAACWLALDLDAGQLRELRADGVRAPLLRLRADALRPPLRTASLDTVACSFSLHHLPHPAGLLARAAGLLSPGGRLVLAEPLADGLKQAQKNHRDLHHLSSAFDRRQGRHHRTTYRLRDLRLMIAHTGLSWTWISWRPPPLARVDLEPVLETMTRLDEQLRRHGHGDLRRRLDALRRRVEVGGYQGQSQFLALGVKDAGSGAAR